MVIVIIYLTLLFAGIGHGAVAMSYPISGVDPPALPGDTALSQPVSPAKPRPTAPGTELWTL